MHYKNTHPNAAHATATHVRKGACGIKRNAAGMPCQGCILDRHAANNTGAESGCWLEGGNAGAGTNLVLSTRQGCSHAFSSAALSPHRSKLNAFTAPSIALAAPKLLTLACQGVILQWLLLLLL